MGVFEVMGNQAGRSAVDAGMKYLGEPAIKDFAEKKLNLMREEDPWSSDNIEQDLKEFQQDIGQEIRPSGQPSGGPASGNEPKAAAVPVTHLKEKLQWMNREKVRIDHRERVLKDVAKAMEVKEQGRQANYNKKMAEVKAAMKDLWVTCIKWGLGGGVIVYAIMKLIAFSNDRVRIAAPKN